MALILNIIIYTCFVSCKSGPDYASFKECQDYNVPLWKNESLKRTALFIFPHADDEITCGGTINQLKKNGWEVNLITFTTGQVAEKAARKKEWNKSTAILGFDHKEIYDLTNNTWDDVLSNHIIFWYDHMDSIENMIYRAILLYQPSVVFTFDTALGGYGHPEHRISALAVYNVFNTHKADSLFPVRKIMQSTLPEKLETHMLAHAEVYSKAMKYTGNNTLPEPTIAFDVLNNWTVKRNAAAAYVSQENTLKKFYLFPDVEDTAKHYETFDREYFHLISR